MSQKWIRSKQWDDRHIPRALWPLKFLLRAFSSIPLAVVLLVGVVLYGTLASVPIGLIALAPTYLIYGLTLLGAIALAAILPARLTTIALARAGVPAAARFIAGFAAVIVLAVAATWLWARFAWPHMRYDPVAHSGFRLFGEFVDATRSITVRRLPALEMSELEFYAWWPLKVILLAFILNMIVATVRRIEFSFHNLGVLTVHTGIVTIALGSIYYSALKEEGDLLLLAGNPDGFGNPTAGPVETGFFDNTRIALWVSSGGTSDDWQQRPLRGVPRYNDYNLGALPAGAAAFPPSREPLSISIAASDQTGAERPPPDAGLQIRVVGYGSYVDLEKRWIKGEGGRGGEPLRRIELLRNEPSPTSKPPSIPFRPLSPNARTVELGSVLGVEYARAMDPQRWRDLAEKLPPGTQHALIVEIPAADPAATPFRAVYPVTPGAQVQVGDTGYSLLVKDIAAQPPFPIITPGYENARSSIAIVRVTPPGAAQGAKPFDRWLYHRFPEIAQDMFEELNERGMPKRRAADPAIRMTYLDCSISQVYFDEAVTAPADAADPPVRALLRPAGGEARLIDDLRTGGTLQIAPNASLRLGERWPSAVQIEVPVPVPEAEREKDSIGNHHHAAIAVEIAAADSAAGVGGWRCVLWLPFTQYLNISPDLVRTIDLPDDRGGVGRGLSLAFGRVRRSLPDFGLQLVDFQMYPYPGSDTPRDYKSDLTVLRSSRDELVHELRNTSLNDPLLVRVPYRPRQDVPAVAGFFGWLVSFVAPTQYKFSQAGWDAEGWRTTQAAADRAELPRARARFTILGVGNNPGIYIIASGAIMMSIGIPWAFYIKPLLVRAKKKRLQAQLAANNPPPAGPRTPPPQPRPGSPVGAQA